MGKVNIIRISMALYIFESTTKNLEIRIFSKIVYFITLKFKTDTKCRHVEVGTMQEE